jgi:ABC-type amino acid transport substrate-binding protein
MKEALCSIILILIFNLTSAQDIEVKLASDNWPPFTGNSSERSLAYDIVKEALQRSFVKSTMSMDDFSKVMDGIKSGIYDGSAALWKDQEREEYLKFSRPYLQNQLILVGRKGSRVDVSDFAELNKAKIGIVSGYAYGQELTSSSDITLVRSTSDQENLDMLLNGDIDYMVTDALLIQYLTTYQSDEAANLLEIGKKPVITRSLHFALRSDFPNADEILSNFDRAIVQMIGDGTYNRILELNWIRADVDGDGKVDLVLKGKNAGNRIPENSYAVWFEQQPSSQATGGFYIDGKFYEDWNDIPSQYKTPPSDPMQPAPVNILKLKIK